MTEAFVFLIPPAGSTKKSHFMIPWSDAPKGFYHSKPRASWYGNHSLVIVWLVIWPKKL
uniref:Uncharacterized protein n=1 Tax=Arundo donax TaxID=35708 RepID=A0A0A9CNG1_ARUDO